MKKQYPYGTSYSMAVAANVHVLEDIDAAVLGKWPRDLLLILIAMARGEISKLVARGMVGRIMAMYTQQLFVECGKMWGVLYSYMMAPCIKITDPDEDLRVFVEMKEGKACLIIRDMTGICRAVRKMASYKNGVLTFEVSAYPPVGLSKIVLGSTPREIYESLKNCDEWSGAEPKWT